MLILAPEQKARLQDYCASSVFVKILMLRGYGFDETSFSRISFQKKVRTSSFAADQKIKTHFPLTHSNVSAGRRYLGGLGSGLHAEFEQLTACRDSGAEEGPGHAHMGNAHLPLRPSPHCRPVLSRTQSLWWKEERKRRKPHLEIIQCGQEGVARLCIFVCFGSVLQHIGSEMKIWELNLFTL